MTKKHFIELADTIKWYNSLQYVPQQFDAHQISVLAFMCAKINPTFNRERWLSYIAGKCGPNGGKR